MSLIPAGTTLQSMSSSSANSGGNSLNAPSFFAPNSQGGISTTDIIMIGALIFLMWRVK